MLDPNKPNSEADATASDTTLGTEYKPAKPLKPRTMKRPVTFSGENGEFAHVELSTGAKVKLDAAIWARIERGEELGQAGGIGPNWFWAAGPSKPKPAVMVSHRYPGREKAVATPVARLLRGLGPVSEDPRLIYFLDGDRLNLCMSNLEIRSRDDDPWVKADRAVKDAEWKRNHAESAEEWERWDGKRKRAEAKMEAMRVRSMKAGSKTA